MITLDRALTYYGGLTPLSGQDSIALAHAHGRVLAQALRSRIDLPPMRQSAMDGYAVHHADLTSASKEQPISLLQTQAVPAGSPAHSLSPQQCARIFTGAPVPAGADAVEIQENVEALGDEVRFTQAVRAGRNIREQGEEIAAGQQVLPAGQLLDAQSLSIAANAGHPYLSCRAQPRVAVIVTGNELVAPGMPRHGAQIYESNGQFLRHFVTEMGARLVSIQTCGDDRTALATKMLQALNVADMLLVSGGASVGDHDYSRAAAQDCGVKEVFWKVAQKPGKPLSFGLAAGDKPVFILPGNPGSVFVGAMVHVRPALLRLAGRPAPSTVTLRIDQSIPADARRERLIRASLKLEHSQLVTTPLPRQASHMSSNLATTRAILRVPAAKDLSKGALVQAWLCKQGGAD